MSTALVRYAGFDPDEAELGKHRARSPEEQQAYLQRQRRRKAIRAYVMFKAGQDTLQIATAMDRKESTILRWISIARSQKRGLPQPYEAKRQ